MNILSIDLGGAYIKCMVIDSQTFNILDSGNHMYGLKASLDINGNIPEEKIIETVQYLKEFLNMGEKYNCTQIKAVATGGIRQSNNSQELLKRIKEETGIDVKLINGAQEANYTYKGILLSFLHDNRYNNFVTIDIGSSSTEISFGNKENIIKTNSVNIGSVNLSLKFNMKDKEFFNDDDINGSMHYLDTLFNDISIPMLNNVAYIVTGSSGYTPLLLNNPQFNNNDKYIKAKPLWTININLLNKCLEEFKKGKNNKTINDILIGTQAPIDKEFCNIIILKYLMLKLNINEIYFSTIGLRHGLLLSENIRYLKKFV